MQLARTTTTASVMLLLGLLSGCVSDDAAEATAANTGAANTGAASTTAEHSADPPLINGFNYPVWASDGYERAVTVTDLDEIAATGAGWVALSITWYQQDPHASCPAPLPGATVRIEGLRRATRMALERGLDVVFKPMVDLPGAADRSSINPEDPIQWFRCYGSLLDDLAIVAEEEGVGLIEIGTELGGTIGYEHHWRAIIEMLRATYSGRLTYGANYDDVADVGFWDDLDLIGVSAYWSLADRPTTDVDALSASWSSIVSDLAPLATLWDRPVLLTELGYRAQVGVTVKPWDWTAATEPDQTEQAAAFAAARRAWTGVDWFGGVLVWTWDDVLDSTDPNTQANSDRPTYSPNGTLSLPIIEAWFADR